MFPASDRLIGAGRISPLMVEYIAVEGLDFGMATPQRDPDAMTAAGFEQGTTMSRNGWYRLDAREEPDRLEGEAGKVAARLTGRKFGDRNIGFRRRMIPVLDRDEPFPTPLAARKPA